MPLSSHAERTEVAFVGRPVDANILDASHARAMAELVKEMLERCSLPLGFHLHGAIVAIADVALEAQLPGVPLGEEAKADTLDIAYDLRLEAAPFLVIGQSGVSERPGRHHDGDPLGGIRNCLEGPADHRQIGVHQLTGRLLSWGTDHETLVVAMATGCGAFPEVVGGVRKVQAQEELQLLPDGAPSPHWQ